jgi:hypothetical protein
MKDAKKCDLSPPGCISGNKYVKIADLSSNTISSGEDKKSFYAGPSFATSPHPTLLHIPKFLKGNLTMGRIK